MNLVPVPISDACRYTFAVEPPVYWEKYKLTVVRDGNCPYTGRRIHFVEEKLGGECRFLSNALVYSVDDLPTSMIGCISEFNT